MWVVIICIIRGSSTQLATKEARLFSNWDADEGNPGGRAAHSFLREGTVRANGSMNR